MSEKGRKQRDATRFKIKAPTPSEINQFKKEFERCIEETDHAAQMYALTLLEAGFSQKEIDKEINRAFWEKLKNLR